MFTRFALTFLVLIGSVLIAPAPARAAATILVFGDSLSAAYGIRQQDGWVSLLQQRLQQQRYDYIVVNASISGETSSGGAARIEAALAQHRPAITIIALGANDGLRGLPVRQMYDNLTLMVRAAKRNNAGVMVAGMKLPPNYGPQYTAEYEKAFKAVAKHYRAYYLPFLLEGVATRRELIQDDNLHPNAAAQPLILENVWRELLPALRKY